MQEVEVADPKAEGLKVGFDGSLRLEFHGVKVKSAAGLLAFRDLDEALGVFDMIPSVLHDSQTRRKIQHHLASLLHQSFGFPSSKIKPSVGSGLVG